MRVEWERLHGARRTVLMISRRALVGPDTETIFVGFSQLFGFFFLGGKSYLCGESDKVATARARIIMISPAKSGFASVSINVTWKCDDDDFQLYLINGLLLLLLSSSFFPSDSLHDDFFCAESRRCRRLYHWTASSYIATPEKRVCKVCIIVLVISSHPENKKNIIITQEGCCTYLTSLVYCVCWS